MQEHPSFPEVIKFILFGGILPLNSATPDSVELNRRLGKMHARNTGPQAAENDGLHEVAVVAIGVQSWGARGRFERDKSQITERVDKIES